MKRIFLAICLALCAAGAMAASVFTSPPTLISAIGGRNHWYYVATVTSDASGDATGTVSLKGYIEKATINPSATAPTNLYDCVLTDADGIDVFGGNLANLLTATSESRVPLDDTGAPTWVPVNGTMTLTCANMGNAKITVINIWVTE